MAVSFSRTLRSMRADRQPFALVGLLLLIVAAGLAWVFLARLCVYEVSTSARLEVLAIPQSVESVLEGRLVESKLHVGLETAVGDVLVTLDGESVRREMEEQRQITESARSQLVALSSEIETMTQSNATRAEVRKLSLKDLQLQSDDAKNKQERAQQQLQRAEALALQKAISADELERLRTEALTAHNAMEAAEVAIAISEKSQLAETQREESQLNGLKVKAQQLDGEAKVSEATLHKLELKLESLTIRAYAAGSVEEVVPIRVGSVVKPGQKLATIVPAGEKRVVAQFPVISVGRIHPGQSARLRMDGFPWTQYGTLAAKVTGVGTESSDGLIRVELAVTDTSSPIPQEHGQTASVEVEVERVAPAAMILRAAGQKLMTDRPVSGS